MSGRKRALIAGFSALGVLMAVAWVLDANGVSYGWFLSAVVIISVFATAAASNRRR